MNRENLIFEYKDADFSKRLNMYMAIPELRDIFIRIDRGRYQMTNGHETESGTQIKRDVRG